jgi:serine/threonine protein kinase
MTPARLQTIEEIFHAALEREPEQLSTFLNKACAGDEVLRRHVEALVASHGEAGDFIDTPVAALVASIVESDQADLLTGQTIGHYKISKLIGTGGMGAVYLAQRADQQYEKRVAIKLLKRGMDTDSVLRHFRNERQILASFDHPNIARLLDGGATESGLPYFVMEYVEGLPIDAYCESQGLSIIERLNLFRHVCAAVIYAHRHTVIHRDIKPSNILLTNDGVPKLLDFGIAKILQPGDWAQPLATMTGLRLMTPEYASPEQIRGQPVTTATDVYSLGVVLFQLLTGQKPYRLKTRTTEEISRAITEEEPLRPSSVVAKRDGNSKLEIRNSKSLKGDLDNIVLMALRKEPERRYQSVEQFSEDIRRHLEALPVLARKDTLAYRSSKFVRRNKAATAAAVLVFLTLLGGIIATTWQAHRATVQEAIARAEKNRAERRFNDVRQLAHSVLFDYHDAIKNLAGATPVRERLVKDALTYLDSLAKESAGDPTLQRELAAAYERVGDVRGEAFSASLGDRAGAIESYSKALRIREAVAAAAPGDIQNRRDLAASYKRLGNQLLETTEAGRGLEQLRKSLMIYSELAAKHPATPEIRHDLAEIYNAIGSALEDTGDIPAALEHHRKALSIYKDLLTANPADRANRRSLSVSYENTGRALFLNNDGPGALENNKQALALREALVTEDPTNADYRRILGISYQNAGDYLAWTKDTLGALESFRKKFAIDEKSLAADPANAQASGDLAYGSERMADLLTELGDPSQAIPYYQRSMELYEKGAATDPQDLSARTRAIVVRAHLAVALAKTGSVASAREECRKTAQLLQALEDQQTNAGQRRMRVLAYTGLGEAYAALAPKNKDRTNVEDWRAARDMYQRGLDLIHDLLNAGIIQADELADADAVARKVAECDAVLRR